MLFVIKKMKKIKQYKYIILIMIIIVMLGYAFYWSEIRPVLVKKTCFEEASYESGERVAYKGYKYYEERYEICLRKNGM